MLKPSATEACDDRVRGLAPGKIVATIPSRSLETTLLFVKKAPLTKGWLYWEILEMEFTDHLEIPWVLGFRSYMKTNTIA